MTASQESNPTLAHLLSVIVKLNLEAYRSPSREALCFLMLNDTRDLFTYERAFLFIRRQQRLEFFGASGEENLTIQSPAVKEALAVSHSIASETHAQILDLEGHVPGGEKLSKEGMPSVLWLPILSSKGEPLYLWLERWEGDAWSREEAKVGSYLTESYAAAWDHHSLSVVQLFFHRRLLFLGSVAAIFFAMTVMQVPLRVVAPCEVVPEDPYLITAPLEGIISEVVVKPGQFVKEGELLFVYDKRVPLQNLRVAEKQVEISQSQLERALTLGLGDSESLNEVAIQRLEIAKDQVELERMQLEVDQLEVVSPFDGVTVLDNPDQWRGKPVQVGERVMIVSEPNRTKLRIFLPERDNILIDPDEAVRVFLNVDPSTTREAQLRYVADFSSMTDLGVPSFTAEALWLKDQPDVKFGLKGSAVLYGEKVSLLYWILRKPWTSFRELIGY